MPARQRHAHECQRAYVCTEVWAERGWCAEMQRSSIALACQHTQGQHQHASKIVQYLCTGLCLGLSALPHAALKSCTWTLLHNKPMASFPSSLQV